jgi:hypothetical protein
LTVVAMPCPVPSAPYVAGRDVDGTVCDARLALLIKLLLLQVC